MKKSIAFLGALFMGSVAFAQVSKNDNINKSPSRKVLDTDLKDLQQDPEENTKTGEIKGEYHQKMKGQQNSAMHKGGTIKGSSIQKSSDASAGAGTIKGEAANEKQTKGVQKGGGINLSTTQKEDFTIKSNGSENKTINGSGTQNAKSSDTFMKIGDIKGEK